MKKRLNFSSKQGNLKLKDVSSKRILYFDEDLNGVLSKEKACYEVSFYFDKKDDPLPFQITMLDIEKNVVEMEATEKVIEYFAKIPRLCDNDLLKLKSEVLKTKDKKKTKKFMVEAMKYLS